jgi:hypothetical protein
LVKTKQVVHIADLVTEKASDSGVLAELAGARTLLAVPMLKDGRVAAPRGSGKIPLSSRPPDDTSQHFLEKAGQPSRNAAQLCEDSVRNQG